MKNSRCFDMSSIIYNADNRWFQLFDFSQVEFVLINSIHRKCASIIEAHKQFNKETVQGFTRLVIKTLIALSSKNSGFWHRWRALSSGASLILTRAYSSRKWSLSRTTTSIARLTTLSKSSVLDLGNILFFCHIKLFFCFRFRFALLALDCRTLKTKHWRRWVSLMFFTLKLFSATLSRCLLSFRFHWWLRIVSPWRPIFPV